MGNKKQKELPMCEMCGDDWVYELDDDANERRRNYRSIKKIKDAYLAVGSLARVRHLLN